MNNKLKATLIGTALAGSGFLAGALGGAEDVVAPVDVKSEVAIENVDISPKIEVTDDLTKPKEEAVVRVTEYEIKPKVTEITQSAVEQELAKATARKASLTAEIAEARTKLENAQSERELQELQGYLRNLQNNFDLMVSTEAFYLKQKSIVDAQVAKLPEREVVEEKLPVLKVPTEEITRPTFVEQTVDNTETVVE